MMYQRTIVQYKRETLWNPYKTNTRPKKHLCFSKWPRNSGILFLWLLGFNFNSYLWVMMSHLHLVREPTSLKALYRNIKPLYKLITYSSSHWQQWYCSFYSYVITFYVSESNIYGRECVWKVEKITNFDWKLFYWICQFKKILKVPSIKHNIVIKNIHNYVYFFSFLFK